jgi:hypothetical protein
MRELWKKAEYSQSSSSNEQVACFLSVMSIGRSFGNLDQDRDETTGKNAQPAEQQTFPVELLCLR